MKILILDDNEIIFGAPEDFLIDPHDFREEYVVQVTHPYDFWKEFKKESWDEIWLDHDLGDSRMTTGRNVTRKIAEMVHQGFEFSSLFRVITMNPSAAVSMMSDLRTSGVLVVQHPISALSHFGVSRGDVIGRGRVLRRNVPIVK